MTDLEKLIDTYRAFGIEVKVKQRQDFQIVSLNGSGDFATESDKFGGYICFYSELIFDSAGKFIRQDFLE